MKKKRGEFYEHETRESYDADSPYRCECNRYVKAAKGRTANGQLWVGLQCQRCGKKCRRSAKLYSPQEIEKMRELDDEIEKRFWGAVSREQEREIQARREKESREWWDAYKAYLQTPMWQERRAKVLKRANWWCEACLEGSATEVHHTTYQHLGNEPLFELRAVCHECHESITAMDRKARGVA